MESVISRFEDGFVKYTFIKHNLGSSLFGMVAASSTAAGGVVKTTPTSAADITTNGNMSFLSSTQRNSQELDDSGCYLNCSGHGECINGACYCEIQFEGQECKTVNFSYHVAFASIFFLLALTTLIQLIMCIHAEYLRMKKRPSVLRACRVTTQKFIYLLVFLASLIRGAYFAAPTIGSEWSTSLLSAYYPVVLTGSSLLVCFWAEVFHLREIRWERPRFLSKSFIGFFTFNVISYSLLIAEVFLIWFENEEREFYTHVFNGIYAVLMFIVVIFFLIYGVEVFFKVRGGFTLPTVPAIITSARLTGSQRPNLASSSSSSLPSSPKRQWDSHHVNDCQESTTTENLLPLQGTGEQTNVAAGTNAHENVSSPSSPTVVIDTATNLLINSSQLHQSRLGLLSQALMMIVTVGFLLAETLEEFWKTKLNLMSRNTHDVIFRLFEIGVALWFPCVLWNCIRPEQLWCLNPKKILERLPPSLRDVKCYKDNNNTFSATKANQAPDSEYSEDDERNPECWICYDDDRTDAGPIINPCNCRGDVGAVHHDCLRRWLVESADNPDALKCKVCSVEYMVEKGSQFSLTQGFTATQWLQTASLVTAMCLSIGGGWAICQIYSESWMKMLAVGSTLLVQYICLRFLGLNTVSAYQRAKVSALKIVNLRIRSGGRRIQEEEEGALPRSSSSMSQ